MPVGDPGNQQRQGDVRRLAGQVAQRGVALQERIFRAPNTFHLEEVIGQREHRRADVFGGRRGSQQGRRQTAPRRRARSR